MFAPLSADRQAALKTPPPFGIMRSRVASAFGSALASIALLSLGTADLFGAPNRSAQQSQLDDYGRYLSAGLVSYAQKGFSR